MQLALNTCPRTLLVASLLLFSLSPRAAQAQGNDAAITSHDAEIGGVKLHYLSTGHGPAVILLHGYTETSRMWRAIMPLFAERFTVIAPDLPGIGDSAIRAEGLHMKASAIRIHALAKSLGIDKAEVVGHDIGLMVILSLSRKQPTISPNSRRPNSRCLC